MNIENAAHLQLDDQSTTGNGESTDFVVLDNQSCANALVATDLLSNLLAEYRGVRAKLERISDELLSPGNSSCLSYFVSGNLTHTARRIHDVVTPEQLFSKPGAIAALNAHFWRRTLDLTEVLDLMPAARRDQWNDAIRDHETPDFTEESVVPTVKDLLANRHTYFAERVDGIFRGLSGLHVTNSPAAFGKRMIVAHVLDCMGYANPSKTSLIFDLRCVVAILMARGEPKHHGTSSIIDDLKRKWGQWVDLDGGAIRIKLYKVGTAHLEVHPDIAWQLNKILATLYPTAIPAASRTRPARRAKAYATLNRPLPFEVIDVLSQVAEGAKNGRTMAYISGLAAQSASSLAKQQAAHVLESIGGAQTRPGQFSFDYPPYEVLRHIVLSGCVPDEKSHQFVPTESDLADMVEAELDVGPGDECLEPSAGQGGIACRLPTERTTCVEISPMNCQILRAKGYAAIEADFLSWSESTWASGKRFSRVALNPPFSEGRASAHLEAAGRLVKDGGRLVAVLPASMRGKAVLPGFSLKWSAPIHNAFSTTNVTVVLLTANRPL